MLLKRAGGGAASIRRAKKKRDSIATSYAVPPHLTGFSWAPPIKGALSFFTEIGDAQGLGRLIFLFLAQADQHQHHNRRRIGDHVQNLRRKDEALPEQADVDVLQLEAEAAKRPEQVGAEDGAQRVPGAEDHQSDGDPARARSDIVLPAGDKDQREKRAAEPA